MSRVDKEFPKNQFCRIHRCYIVALSAITDFTNDDVHVQGKCLPFGPAYRKLLFERIITLGSDAKIANDPDLNNLLKKFGLN